MDLEMSPLDHIHLHNISLPHPVGIIPDAWHRSDKPQPVTISIRVAYPASLVAAAAASDDVSLTLDYGKLYRGIKADIQTAVQKPAAVTDVIGLRYLAEVIGRAGFNLLRATVLGVEGMGIADNRERAGEVEVGLHLPKAILRADGGLKYQATMRLPRKKTDPGDEIHENNVVDALWVEEQEFRIEGIRCYCILGVNPHERLEKQAVVITLVFRWNGTVDWSNHVATEYRELTKAVSEVSRFLQLYRLAMQFFPFASPDQICSLSQVLILAPKPQGVDASTFQTVEALATFIARIVTIQFDIDRVTVIAEKPSAIAFLESSLVEITRTRGFFEKQRDEDKVRGRSHVREGLESFA
jgi:dihydroneopterin aldolase